MLFIWNNADGTFSGVLTIPTASAPKRNSPESLADLVKARAS